MFIALKLFKGQVCKERRELTSHPVHGMESFEKSTQYTPGYIMATAAAVSFSWTNKSQPNTSSFIQNKIR